MTRPAPHAMAKGMVNRARPSMVFDWEKAAALIADRKPKEASAGLCGDWEWTGGIIYRDGAAVTDEYTYLSSTWATPELDMDGDVVECWRWATESPGWGADTKWPPVALVTLAGAPLAASL